MKEWKNVTWIWCNDAPKPDEYAEFWDTFQYRSGKVIARISADSQYALYVNGKLAAWGQYADYPYDKVYDEVDITPFCRVGENRAAFVIWYLGTETVFTYYKGNAALAYELICDEQVLCKSGTATQSRLSKTYRQHAQKIITSQLGYGFAYDASAEDEWICKEAAGFTPAVVVEQELPLRIRPCDKLAFLAPVEGILCKKISDTESIYDLGKEQVGFLQIECDSESEQDVLISYGEHLLDGCVRRLIGSRDFSVEYRTKVGKNDYMNPFRRLAGRYLQVKSQTPLKELKVSIVPTMYVLEEQKRPALTEVQEKIYDICVETLHLCMHEHYEDCPWREQSLYAMDSRNQMLCGYYAFGETRFQRSNLQLISKDNRSDNMLSICYPTNNKKAIPSFSLHYITACLEYLQHSGDKEFLEEIYDKLKSVLQVFAGRKTDGILVPFEGPEYWNFYEWTDALSSDTAFFAPLDASGMKPNRKIPDLLLNTLYSLELQKMAEISDELGKESGNSLREEALLLNETIVRTFWNKEMGLFSFHPDGKDGYSQLGNALAVLCGAADLIPGAADAIADFLCGKGPEGTIEVSLSMVCFKYDALLKINKEKYAAFILAEIERTYQKMLDFGSTTVWETAIGANDFDNAGSLCHGWSAMPIYYYHLLLS